jgi:hypothetical protein
MCYFGAIEVAMKVFIMGTEKRICTSVELVACKKKQVGSK